MLQLYSPEFWAVLELKFPAGYSREATFEEVLDILAQEQSVFIPAREAASHAQLEYLSGNLRYEGEEEYQGMTSYQVMKAKIDLAISRLQTARADVEYMQSHKHEWNPNDYCNICGSDGRA